MGTRLRQVLAAVAIVIALTLAWSAPIQAYELEDEVVEYKLSNGMRWLLVKRDQAPVFSGIVQIRAGTIDEPEDKTGIAHMFEHMAFKGSKILGARDWKKEKEALDRIEDVGRRLTEAIEAMPRDIALIAKLRNELKKLEQERRQYANPSEVNDLMLRNGAAGFNAWTSLDSTAYVASMPINKLELWAAVFSEMIGDTVYRAFYTERDVVVEERRMRIDDHPDGQLMTAILENSFQENPYRNHPIGTRAEIESFLIDDARTFKKKHYTPDRMVGVLVGDLDIDTTKGIIKKYFGRLHKGKVAEQPKAVMDKGTGEHVLVIDAQPSVVLTYHKPTLPNPEEYVSDVALVSLCFGPTSRLYRELVIEKKLALDISCSNSTPGAFLPNLMLFWVEAIDGTDPHDIVETIEAQLNELKENGLRPEEIERARTKISAGIIYGMQENEQLAKSLAEYEVKFNDWRLLPNAPNFIGKVTSDDVRAFAKKYFTDENQTVIIRTRKAQ